MFKWLVVDEGRRVPSIQVLIFLPLEIFKGIVWWMTKIFLLIYFVNIVLSFFFLFFLKNAIKNIHQLILEF